MDAVISMPEFSLRVYANGQAALFSSDGVQLTTKDFACKILDPAGWKNPSRMRQLKNLLNPNTVTLHFDFASGEIITWEISKHERHLLIRPTFVETNHPVQILRFKSAFDAESQFNGSYGRLDCDTHSVGIIPSELSYEYGGGPQYLLVVSPAPHVSRSQALFVSPKSDWIACRDRVLTATNRRYARPSWLKMPYLMTADLGAPISDVGDQLLSIAKDFDFRSVMLVAPTWYDRQTIAVKGGVRELVSLLHSGDLQVILHTLPVTMSTDSILKDMPHERVGDWLVPTFEFMPQIMDRFASMMIDCGADAIYTDGLEKPPSGIAIPHWVDAVVSEFQRIVDIPVMASGAGPLTCHTQGRIGQTDLWTGLSQPWWKSPIHFVCDAVMRRAEMAQRIGVTFDGGWWGLSTHSPGGDMPVTYEEHVVYVQIMRAIMAQRDTTGAALCMYASIPSLLEHSQYRDLAALYRGDV